MTCRVNASMQARGNYKKTRYFQRLTYLRQDQRYLKKPCSDTLSGNDSKVLHGDRLVAERETYMD